MKKLKKWFIIALSVICIMGCGNGTKGENNNVSNMEDDQDDHGTYTIMVYMVGSDLESQGQFASGDIIEMLESGVDLAKTNIVLCTGGAQQWGIGLPNNETIITQIVDEDGKVGLTPVGSFGESVNMGESDTLSTFLDYGYENYKTDHYALICWDHGGGPVRGYGNDELYGYDSLEFAEMKKAMEDSPFSDSNKLDWIGFDACLMASVEIADLFSDYADYLIASEEVEPGCGWDYSFLSVLNETSGSKKIAKSIIDSYEAYILGHSDALYCPDITLSCMDLNEISTVTQAMDGLFSCMNDGLGQGDYQKLSQLRSDTKAISKGSELDLVDLGHTAKMMSEMYPEESDALISALEKLVIYQATNVPSTYGVSVYYPYESEEEYSIVENMQSETESGVELLHSSEGYSSYFENYTDIWLNGEPSTEWTTNLIELSTSGESTGGQKEDELLVQLTDKQMSEFVEAYYTIYCDYGNNDYTPVLMNCRILPDKNGILRVSLNQDLIVGRSGEPGAQDTFWMFKEVEHREDGIRYQSVGTMVSGPFGVFSRNATYEPVVVSVFESTDGEMIINSMNYTSDSATPEGKMTVNLEHWDMISNVFSGYHPEYDENGNMLSYKHWKKDDGLYAREIPLENLQFAKRNINDFNESFVCQVTVVDIYGNEYSTKLESMHQDEYPKVYKESTSEGDFQWELYEDYAKLEKYEGNATELHVPNSVKGLPVAVIGGYAFNKNDLEKIVLPDSVSMLEEYCFANCSTLQTVELSDNIVQIPQSAFEYCSSLIVIELPDSVKQIGRFAFKDCSSLKSIQIPKNVELISSGVFYGCDYLKDLEVDAGNPFYVSVEGALFSKDMKKLVACPSLFRNSYIIPEGVEEIVDFAFADCYMEKLSGSQIVGYGLTEIVLPDSLKVIGDGAFLNCKRLNEIKLPNSLEMIGSLAFGNDSMFDNVDVGDFRVEKSELSSLHIGDNVSWIGDGAFFSFDVGQLTVSDRNRFFTTNGKQLFNKDGTVEIEAFR